MKHLVQIRTRLVCHGEDGEEVVERIYRGTWSRRDDRHLLHYLDEENGGEVHFLISPGRADLRRSGNTVSRMVFAEVLLHESDYATQAGVFQLGVRTGRYGLCIADDGGRLQAAYAIETGGRRVSFNELLVIWKYLN